MKHFPKQLPFHPSSDNVRSTDMGLRLRVIWRYIMLLLIFFIMRGYIHLIQIREVCDLLYGIYRGIV